MSDKTNRELSDLFANDAPPPPSDAKFVSQVSSKLHTRRRILLAVRIALLIAIVVTIAPFVPSFIVSLLKIIGL
jgi:hypothetical protein